MLLCPGCEPRAYGVVGGARYHHTTVAATNSAFKCSKFAAMDPLQRYDVAKKRNLCLNCLGKNHLSSKYPSINRCQHCKVSHHTLLHRNSPSTLTSTDPIQAPSASLHSHMKSNDVILATAVVQLHNNKGNSITARALLDPASQLNFISERITNMLKLSRTKIAMEISGIGALRTKAKYVALIGIKSMHTGFTSLVEVVIMPSISSSQPRCPIEIAEWGIPQNINLADKTFHIPGVIDLLLGAGIFFDILSVGQIKLQKNLPTLQRTQLCWVVAGVLTASSSLSLSSVFTSSATTYTESSSLTNSSLESLLERFWNLEDVCYKPPVDNATTEHECEKHIRENTTGLVSNSPVRSYGRHR
ncbi:uncharacterized protein [Eurosta solidaginis]|uniref:uncharacterized protein n=1 Tax=Eurosta solidaginis TaxID=178769 RepID=UPI0035307034